MPRLRLAARFLRGAPSSSAASCSSCQAAAAAGTSPSSSTLNPSGEAIAKEKRFPRFPGIFPSTERSSVHEHPSRQPVRHLYLAGSFSSGHRHPDLIIGMKQRDEILGQKPRSRSFSAAYSTSFDHDRHDGRLEPAVPIPQQLEQLVVDPRLRKCEEEEVEETEVVEAVTTRWDAALSSSSTDDDEVKLLFLRSDLFTTSIDDDDEPEAIRWGASLSTSSAEDESELSELEFVRIDGLADDEDDDRQLEAVESRSEVDDDSQWTGSSAERSRGEDDGSSDLLADFLDVVGGSTAADDAREGGVFGEPGADGDLHNGVPYLHALSVGEVREVLEKARAKDVRVVQVGKCCEWVDNLVFASGRSSRHLRGMADAIVYKVKQLSENVGPNSFPLVEGRNGEQWMAVDCGSIVVHLFLEEARSYYNLEDFWMKKANPRLVDSF